MSNMTNSAQKERPEDDPGLQQQQSSQLLTLQRDILESIALGDDPDKILNALCLAAEAIVPNSVSSIMLLNHARDSLEVRSAPSIPVEAIQQLNGLVPGPAAGSCGTAVFLDEPCYVSDTGSDPRWVNLKQFACDFNILACWSYPIRTRQDEVLGSFALSSFASRPPTTFQKQLLGSCANIAGIILQREKQEHDLWHLAHHDSLTGMPNRILLDLRLEHAIEQAGRKGKQLALLYIDLDNFKDINDSYGHKTGDEVLQATAQRIQEHIRVDDTLARYGGDEFVLLLEELADSLNAITIAGKISESFRKPLPVKAPDMVVTASIGISVYPDDTRDAHVLLKNADIAMYKAKSLGRDHSIFYEPALTEAVHNRIRLETELRQALANHEFVLHYQPQFPAGSAHATTAEVLVRWDHPDRGLLPPAEFITAAEQTGLICELGNQILEQACVQGKLWLDAGMKLKSIAVNFSVQQIQSGCHRSILGILEKTGFPAACLELEVTESLMMENSQSAIAELNKIRSAGISIALDDFGTGHSSLSQLKKLPIDRLKIDQSFVTGLPDDSNDAIFAKTIIAMGHGLGLEVIAEGVETVEQQRFLLQQGCDISQGFLLGRPVPAEELETFLHK